MCKNFNFQVGQASNVELSQHIVPHQTESPNAPNIIGDRWATMYNVLLGFINPLCQCLINPANEAFPNPFMRIIIEAGVGGAEVCQRQQWVLFACSTT